VSDQVEGRDPHGHQQDRLTDGGTIARLADTFAVRHALPPEDPIDMVALRRYRLRRAIAERMTAAGHDQRDPAAVAAYTAQLQACAGHDVWNRLGSITCPVLVGYGNYDGIAPAGNSEKIASRIRGAELHGYEGGHGFLFQDPAALPAYIAFLKAPSS
jgi:pimeloyl-ACP methyl ester carboxylesterase